MNEVAVREEVVRIASAPVAGATTLLQAITTAAANPAVDIEKMERLFAMHQKMVSQESEAAFNDAMARAQAKIEPVTRNQWNDHTKKHYADLARINALIVPVYSGEGLSVSFDTAESPIKDWLRVLATVSHRQGHSRQYHFDLPLDDTGAQGRTNKTGVQASGSTITYGRRYLTLMIFNVSTHDDKDGNKDKEKESVPDPEGKKILEACASMGSLSEAWKNLTAAQRVTLGDIKNECKARIQEANKAAA